MELRETLEALAKKGILTAIDLGEHQYCQLDTNCPLAIQVRKIIADSGITLPQLLEGIDAVQNPDKLFKTEDIAHVSGKAEIYVLNKKMDFDITDVLQGDVQRAFRDKLNELEGTRLRLERLGQSCYNTYLSEIRRLRTTKVLPQFRATTAELARYGAMITEDEGNYVFLFNAEYNPQWIVHDGDRYLMSDRDIARAKRPALLKFSITRSGEVMAVLLLNPDGSNLVHYHGTTGMDCWGQLRFKLPRKLITVEAVHNLKRIAQGALATINYDSLLNRSPQGMTPSGDVLANATKLGKEGELDRPVIPEQQQQDARPAGWTVDTETVNTAPRWGQRRT